MPGWAKRARCSSSIGCRRPLPQGTSVAGHSPVAPTNSWSSLPPALRVDPMRTRSESPVPMLRTRSTRRCAARLDVVIERRPARTRASYRCSTVRGSMAARARGGATMKRGRYFTIPQAVEAYPGVLTERLIRRLVAQRRIAFRLRRQKPTSRTTSKATAASHLAAVPARHNVAAIPGHPASPWPSMGVDRTQPGSLPRHTGMSGQRERPPVGGYLRPSSIKDRNPAGVYTGSSSRRSSR
jgi:hypothetical protein